MAAAALHLGRDYGRRASKNRMRGDGFHYFVRHETGGGLCVQSTTKPSEKVLQLLNELDDDSFAVREAASTALAKLGRTIHPILRHRLKTISSPEVRRRVEVLLENAGQETHSEEHVRQLRAVQVLEHCGSADAVKLLTELASGVSHSPQTQAAKAALERMSFASQSQSKNGI